MPASKGRRTTPRKLKIARQILGNASGQLKPKFPGRACPEVKMWLVVKLVGSHTMYSGTQALSYKQRELAEYFEAAIDTFCFGFCKYYSGGREENRLEGTTR